VHVTSAFIAGIVAQAADAVRPSWRHLAAVLWPSN